MSEKIMLIAGCSHTAGSEIDGSTDSIYNRKNSYGNLLAKKLGYKPINIAVCGYTNSAIARSVLEWFHHCYNHTMDVFVLVGWTESSRIEAPFEFPTWHNEVNGKYCDWFSNSSIDFLQINVSHTNFDVREKEIQNDYQIFITKQTRFTEILSANFVLQLQYFLNSKNCDYLMVNTGHMFTIDNYRHLSLYMHLLDRKKYYMLHNNEQSFYNKYKSLGYTNEKAKYAHHGEAAHKEYAELLYTHLMENANEAS